MSELLATLSLTIPTRTFPLPPFPLLLSLLLILFGAQTFSPAVQCLPHLLSCMVVNFNGVPEQCSKLSTLHHRTRQAACDKNKINKYCLHENNRHSTMLLSFFLHRPYLPTKRSPRAVLLKTRLARGRLSCGGFTLQRYILTDILTKASFVSAITKRNPVARHLLIFVKGSCALSGKHWAGFVIQNGNSKGGRSFFCLRCSMGVAR